MKMEINTANRLTSAGSAAAERRPIVEIAFEEWKEQLKELLQELAQLEIRLGPILELKQEDKDPDFAHPPEAVRSPIVLGICDASSHVKFAVRQVCRISGRLEC